MKSLRILKTDIEKAWLKKLDKLPIRYFSEQPHAFFVIVDDDFDTNLLNVKFKNFYSLEKHNRRKLENIN